MMEQEVMRRRRTSEGEEGLPTEPVVCYKYAGRIHDYYFMWYETEVSQNTMIAFFLAFCVLFPPMILESFFK